jgi:periplasmic divalent cation tolerance protein
MNNPSRQDIVIVFCTIAEEDKAAEIARTLVNLKLAPCANIIPRIRSIYTWKDVIYDEGESLIIIKTRKSLVGLLEKKIKELHPYEVPEIIAFDLTDGHKPYLDWVLANTREP